MSGADRHPEDPTTKHIRIFTAPLKLNWLTQRFRQLGLLLSIQIDGNEQDNITTRLNHEILTHCSNHNILIPSCPGALGDYLGADDEATEANFASLSWNLASIGYTINPRGTGPYVKMTAGNLRFGEMTLGNLSSSSVRKVKNPIRDSPMLIIGTSMFSVLSCDLTKGFPAPSFGCLEGPAPENTQGGAVMAHPCFAARALHGFLTNDVNELANTSPPECFPSCPKQIADPVTPASSRSASSRVSSGLTTPATSVHSLPSDQPALRLTIPPPPVSASQSTPPELSPALSADIETFDNPLDFIRSRTRSREQVGLDNALTHKSLSSWRAHVLSLVRCAQNNRERMFRMRGPDIKVLSEAFIEFLIEGHSGRAGLSDDRQAQLDVRISTVSEIHRIFQGEVSFTSYVSLLKHHIPS
jgi:hypothetical protein